MPAEYTTEGKFKLAKSDGAGGFVSDIASGGSDPIGSLSFVAESGFSISGAVADLAEVTISGQDFGTKSPQRHFDRIDRYWKNGTEVVEPYAGAADGDPLPTSFAQANAPFLGSSSADLSGWELKSEAARPGRALGYQLSSEPDGKMEGFNDNGFAGWPASQRDAERIYVRHWRFMLYPPTDGSLDEFDGVGAPAALASSLSAGATQMALAEAPRIDRFDDNVGVEFYLEMDDGSLQRFTQIAPVVDYTSVTFDPPLPSPASAGNRVHIRRNSAHKELRIRDMGASESSYNVYGFSGYQDSTSNISWDRLSGRPEVAWREGEWELWEHYTVAPKTEAEAFNNLKLFTRINGQVVLDYTGVTADLHDMGMYSPSVGWPSSGCAVTLYGYEEDRPHTIPGNKFRLSDTYIDNSRMRFEIGIGNDDLYQCFPRECCPISEWSGDITVKFNALPFTEAELAQARLFVVGEDDVPVLVGRVQ